MRKGKSPCWSYPHGFSDLLTYSVQPSPHPKLTVAHVPTTLLGSQKPETMASGSSSFEGIFQNLEGKAKDQGEPS